MDSSLEISNLEAKLSETKDKHLGTVLMLLDKLNQWVEITSNNVKKHFKYTKIPIYILIELGSQEGMKKITININNIEIFNDSVYKFTSYNKTSQLIDEKISILDKFITDAKIKNNIINNICILNETMKQFSK